jgi:serine/threonine-protein kinase
VSEDGTFKLGDFGIAKTIEKTMGGTKTGTYSYMAPEVYLNKPYGSAADQYSLGMVIYWLLNNRTLPFLAEINTIPSFEEIEESRQRRMDGEQLPPPAKGSDALKAIVIKACSPDPEDRYESPKDFLDVLKGLVYGNNDNQEPAAAAAPEAVETEEHTEKLRHLAAYYGVTPMDDPYTYIRSLQDTFDYNLIPFSDDYYDSCGLPNPNK